MNVWFVTPARNREEIADICYSALQWLFTKVDFEGHCVVVSDDENLSLAQSRRFDTEIADSPFLGDKYNQGIAYAKEHGADYIVPWANDNWVSPAKFYGMDLGGHSLVTGRNMAFVREDGEIIGSAEVWNEENPYGAGPFVIPAKALPNDPLDAYIDYGVDRIMVEAALQNTKLCWRPARGEFEFVGFRSADSLTSYETLRKLVKREYENPWNCLTGCYPEWMVAQMSRVYEGGE